MHHLPLQQFNDASRVHVATSSCAVAIQHDFACCNFKDHLLSAGLEAAP